MAKPYTCSLANQKLCYIQMYKILEKKIKNVFENAWLIRTLARISFSEVCIPMKYFDHFQATGSFMHGVPPEWVSGEHVGLMTWWLRVQSTVEATFLSGVFLPLTSAEACEKTSRWLWKEKLCSYWCEKVRKHRCVTDRHDMTLAVEVALNPNTTKQFSCMSNFEILFGQERQNYAYHMDIVMLPVGLERLTGGFFFFPQVQTYLFHID